MNVDPHLAALAIVLIACLSGMAIANLRYPRSSRRHAVAADRDAGWKDVQAMNEGLAREIMEFEAILEAKPLSGHDKYVIAIWLETLRFGAVCGKCGGLVNWPRHDVTCAAIDAA